MAMLAGYGMGIAIKRCTDIAETTRKG